MRKHIEEELLKTPEVENYSRRTGARLALAVAEPHRGDFLVKLKADRKRSVGEIKDDLRDRIHAAQDRLRVEVTAKPDGAKGFVPLPKRWVVEPTFGCPIKSRRLVRDYERLSETSAAMVKLSCIHRMARPARPPRGRRKFRYRRKTVA